MLQKGSPIRQLRIRMSGQTHPKTMPPSIQLSPGHLPPSASLPEPRPAKAPGAADIDQIHATISRLAEVVGQLTELAHLRTEVSRLSKVEADLLSQLDMYRRASQAWAAAQITDADIKRYAQNEPGGPIDSFIAELEQRVRGQ
jgi:hypothetical protein